VTGTDTTDRLVSIVLPVKDQAGFIASIVHRYREALQRSPFAYELILVVNDSSDGSENVCRTLAQEDEGTRMLELDAPGWGRAVKAGLAGAAGDTLCYTNSARTTPEVLTLAILYALVVPDVVVKANRKIRDNWRRRLGSVLYNLECRQLLDLATWDINGTPKVFSRDFSELMSLSRDDDLIDAEFVWTCRRMDYRVLELPVLVNERHGGKSTTNYRSALKMYLGALRFAHRSGNG
jgi:glycosyltransferase involved in cell wall biosynthesis